MQKEDKKHHNRHSDEEFLPFQGKRERFHLEKSDNSSEQETEFYTQRVRKDIQAEGMARFEASVTSNTSVIRVAGNKVCKVSLAWDPFKN